MNHATRTKQHPLYGRVEHDADLGIAMLIAETEDGHYEPIGPVATVNEAHEIAAHDMNLRMHDLEKGGEPACPATYKIWSRDYEGEYTIIHEFDAATLSPPQPRRKTRR